jgi:hypothetical protein
VVEAEVARSQADWESNFRVVVAAVAVEEQ